MNTIQTAITTALRAKPVIERVWAEINEKPYSTSKQIATRLNIAENRSAAAMTEMQQRGMVKCRPTPIRMANGSMRQVKEWWCVYTKYERLPVVKKPPKAAIVKEYHAKHPLVPPVAPATVMPAPVPLAAPEQTPARASIKESDMIVELNALELRTALFIYKHLHVIFNHPSVV